MDRDARIFVAGHRGLVGSAIVRRLRRAGHQRLLLAPRDRLDLRDQAAVDAWFRANRPEYVIVAAGTVGGIHANATRPAEFVYDNLMIHATVVHAAHRHGTRKLLYLGSACIYPRETPQPIPEEALLGGPLEPTNRAYAVAKIAGLEMCRAYRSQYGSSFISAMPTNLYGPHDDFGIEGSHVIPALVRRFCDAKAGCAREVVVWGSGNARREFLHVDDLADACLFLMERYDGAEPVNVGSGEDLSIRELAQKIRALVAPGVGIRFDPTRPDGTPRRRLDVSRLHALGWRHRIGLDEGLRATVDWFRANRDAALRREPSPGAPGFASPDA